MLNDVEDGQLIKLFRESGDRSAFEALVRRHYATVLNRFIKRTGSRDDAEELTQHLWIRVIENLENYDESGKFPNYLSTIATNMLADHWRKRGVRGAVDVDWPDDEEAGADKNINFADSADVDAEISQQDAIAQLVTELIPSLPVEQRTIYLLRHESEHWETKQRLEWTHLAEMNGTNVDTAWQQFDEARRKLLVAKREELQDTDALCSFLVWTQAQRPDKKYKFTDQDFSEMLGVPVNTLKTRYKSAVKRLADGLKDWRT